MQRIHKNRRDYGIKDYYNYFKKNNKDIDITRGEFNKIITEYNKAICDFIIEDNMIYQIPFVNLQFVIRKDKRKPRLIGSKLVNPTPIDWKTTKDLWARDEDAKKQKLLVRYRNSHTSGYVFRIYMKKFRCKTKYSKFMKFRPNRVFQRNLAKRIKDESKDVYDAYLLFNNKNVK